MRISVSGPMYSGKTSLTRYMESELGFARYDDSYMLKELAGEALRAIGVDVSTAQIATNKKRYRPFLQELGFVVGYDDPIEPAGVAMTHERWVSEGKPDNAVHETTRTAYQSNYLRRHGWKVVLLKVDPDLQLERAKKLGVTAEEIEKWSRHPVDSGLPEMCADWVVDGSWPIEYVAKEILRRMKEHGSCICCGEWAFSQLDGQWWCSGCRNRLFGGTNEVVQGLEQEDKPPVGYVAEGGGGGFGCGTVPEGGNQDRPKGLPKEHGKTQLSSLEQDLVAEFHGAMGIPEPEEPTPLGDRWKLRSDLITEEAKEFTQAAQSGDTLAMIDGLCDLLYVTYGAAVEMGINLAPFFLEVHKSNMAKVGGPKRADGKLLKPEGWEPPNLKKIYEWEYGELSS